MSGLVLYYITLCVQLKREYNVIIPEDLTFSYYLCYVNFLNLDFLTLKLGRWSTAILTQCVVNSWLMLPWSFFTFPLPPDIGPPEHDQYIASVTFNSPLKFNNTKVA